MAMSYSFLPALSSTLFVLRVRRTVRLTNSTEKEFVTADRKVSINTGNVGCYPKYNYGRCITGGLADRPIYMNSIYCTHTQLAEVEDNDSSINTLKTPTEQLKLFISFTRPYACVGIIIGIVSSSLIAIENLSDISLRFLIGLLKAAAAFGCLCVYVNGVNQLFDIEIDKINKAYLPIASGEMTIETGVSIASAFGLVAFAIGISVGSIPLLWGIFLQFIIFSAYSVKLPFLRWKNSAVGAAFTLLAGSGIISPVATYLHIQTFVFGRQAIFPKPLVFATIITSVLFVVVALFKDIPDIKGDRKFGVRSLTALLGPNKVFWICVYLIQMAYTFAIVVGATSSYLWSKLITIVSHVALSLILWKQAKSVDLEDENAMQSFYMFIWKLIYAEYLLIPLVR